ncbi:hypothetical protein ACN38_g373 [Penicillium nordicum]|uniref:Uncharacterized protein n=1 Tax=Penicillium nordicum TaxID=229535 RepID=A0A0M8PHC3_9EURO|nr:hypothetical protein ACN38_g373 [Penicillium nordicum]
MDPMDPLIGKPGIASLVRGTGRESLNKFFIYRMPNSEIHIQSSNPGLHTIPISESESMLGSFGIDLIAIDAAVKGDFWLGLIEFIILIIQCISEARH